ncbi:MAG: hypothetical protein AABX37_00595, partial [Nanoarchaeota archaeon]
MKKHYLLFASALTVMNLLFTFPKYVASQELKLLPGEVLPVLENVQVKANVTLSTSKVYTYAYTITNSPTNTAEIWSIEIDIKKPTDGQDVGSEGIVSGPRFTKHTSELVLSEITTPLIPVGISSPPDWISGLSIQATAGWGGPA